MNADVHPLKTKAEVALANIFAAAQAGLPGTDAVAALRADAFESFVTTGLPHRRVETWRYTDLRALMRDLPPLAPPPDELAKQRAQACVPSLAGVDCRRLVLVDGAFVPDLSDLADLEPGLNIGSMAVALSAGDRPVAEHLGQVIVADDAALAINTALMGDGVVIQVAAGAMIERPLHIIAVTTSDTPAAMFMRSLVVIDRGARATVIESYIGPEQPPYQVNTALELVVGDGASVEHVKITQEGSAALHLATLLASIGADATFDHLHIAAGGAIVRDQLFVHCGGTGAVVGVNGASILSGEQHADTTLFVDHAAPGCRSRALCKAVLGDASRAVFQGKITVRPGAQQTDARMMARALLLSDQAEANSKPELEIFADDVQCGHGSTASGLDETLKFYLMARGIPAQEAEALLVQAFVGEAIEDIAHEGLREALMNAAIEWLRAR